MEIDRHHIVPVEAELEEEEVDSLQKRRSRLPNVISTNSVYDASNGVDSKTGNEEIEVESVMNGGDHSSTDSEIVDGIDFELPKNGAEAVQEIPSVHNSSVYFDESHGTESVDGFSEMKNGFSLLPNSNDADMNSSKDLKEIYIADMKECREDVGNGFPNSTLTPLEDCLEEQTMNTKSFDNGNAQVGDFNSIEEVDQEETEYDVAEVLQKQNTHDLYCPNCHSCITRRVILRRKRKVRNPRRKTKNNKVDANASSQSDVIAINSSTGQVHETVEIHSSDSPAVATENRNSERDPEVFRCLACFSFFIPTGDGFKMFWPFGDKSPNENVRDLQKTPATASNRNWFSSIFRTDKKNIAVEQVLGVQTLIANQEELLASAASPSLVLTNSMETVSQQTVEGAAISSKEDNEHSEKASIHIGEKLDIATIKANAEGTDSKAVSTAQEANSQREEKLLSGSVVVHQETSATFSSGQGTAIFKETKETTVMKETSSIGMGDKNTGNDVILVVETPVVSQTPLLHGNDGSVTVSSVLQTGTPAFGSEGGGVGLDILKSIVYGGLIESITSLGVVSSAAGAGSSTLNILALGLANLVGGLFLICHNLIDLKNDTSNGTEDRYQATLGRRGKFPLHVTVAILSFLTFGMLAPVLYGFSFRKSNDRDLKLAVAGGASLVCIFLLAVGKAYVRRPPKAYLSTVLYYVMAGVTASGVSFVIGDLLDKFMERLGWFNESGLMGPVIVPAGNPMHHEWVSF